MLRHKRQAKVETVELLQKEAVQPPCRRFKSAYTDVKNIREFNQLKYRGKGPFYESNTAFGRHS